MCPQALRKPMPLEVVQLVDDVLPQYGIHIYPADPAHLLQEEGLTDPDADEDEIIILVRERLWNDLEAGGRQANRAKATVLHELSHGILHVPVIRRRRHKPHSELLLRRVPAGSITPFCNPEWQAWTLAGCLAMPRKTLMMLKDRSPANVAGVYEVSEDFARGHLRRLRLIRNANGPAASPRGRWPSSGCSQVG